MLQRLFLRSLGPRRREEESFVARIAQFHSDRMFREHTPAFLLSSVLYRESTQACFSKQAMSHAAKRIRGDPGHSGLEKALCRPCACSDCSVCCQLHPAALAVSGRRASCRDVTASPAFSCSNNNDGFTAARNAVRITPQLFRVPALICRLTWTET